MARSSFKMKGWSPFTKITDLTKKTGLGPRASKSKVKIDEEEEQVIENMSNQETSSQIIQHEMYLKKLREEKEKKNKN